MKKKSLILTFALFSMLSYSQNIDYKNLAKKEGANFYEIVTQTRELFKTLDMSILQNKKAKKQFERWAYDWTNKINPDGTFPDENTAFYNTGILDSAGKIVKQTETSTSNRSSLSSQSWTNIGPSQTDLNNNAYPNYPQMGRLNAFLRIKHPTNTNLDVLFVGTPNGGIWKSTDGGSTWTPKIDFIAAIGITDIETVPGTTTDNYLTRPIYVSTGDYDGSQAKSIGVLKSTDGGETFASTGLTFTIVNDKTMGDLIVIDANTVFAGGPDTIKKTVDGGSTWTDAFDPNLSSRDFGRAAINGNEIMFTNGYGGVVYSPNHTSAPFTQVVADDTNNTSKTAVTVGEDGEFYIQTQAGQIKKFNKTNSTFANFGTISAEYNSQQGYNQAIVVKNNLVVTGEFNGNTSTDNGATWTRSLNGYWTSATSPGTYIHSDHHRMGTLDGSLDFWSCNDGGLSYISYPNATSTTPTITYKTSPVKITQLYTVAINPNANDGATVISNQDNDSMSKFNGQWYAIAQGDGIQSAVNYNVPAIMYAGNQSGAVTQSNTGFVGQVNGNGNSVSIPGASFYFPLEMNKTNPNVLYGGGTDVSIITSTATATEQGTLTIAPANSGVTSKVISIATHGNAVLAASVSEIKFSSNGGTSWTNIVKPADASGNITSVEFNGTNNAIMYVTFNGYTDTKKVYKSTDSGANWTNISGNLPNIVMNEVLLKQGQATEILFVATNLGVYYTTDGGTAWTKLGQGLPNTDVRDIDIHYTADKLVAGTFGRGLWEVNIVNNTLGNESFSNELKVTVFPNPTTDFINISGENTTYSYVIYNVVGGIVKKGQINTNTPIDVKDLATNNYILNITSGKLNKTIKFIKN